MTESVVLCYASEDTAPARWLAEFIEINLPLAVSLGEAVIGPDLDLLEATERALSAQAAIVLLSPSSVPKVWDRKTWEPLFLEKPKEFQTQLGFMLLAECKFPALLRRDCFFDATGDLLVAARAIKRWLLRPFESVRLIPPVASALDEIQRTLADQPGFAADIDSALAAHFADACADDFEVVYRFDCGQRSRAGMVGDIGSELGLPMSGTLEQNRATLVAWFANHRGLLLIAGIAEQDREFVFPGGRASVLFMPEIHGHTRSVVADAVRSFQAMRDVDVEQALRLGWIALRLLKVQERVAEVLEVLNEMASAARSTGNRDALSKIEKEQFWLDDARALEVPPLIDEGEQLSLRFE